MEFAILFASERSHDPVKGFELVLELTFSNYPGGDKGGDQPDGGLRGLPVPRNIDY